MDGYLEQAGLFHRVEDVVELLADGADVPHDGLLDGLVEGVEALRGDAGPGARAARGRRAAHLALEDDLVLGGGGAILEDVQSGRGAGHGRGLGGG